MAETGVVVREGQREVVPSEGVDADGDFVDRTETEVDWMFYFSSFELITWIKTVKNVYDFHVDLSQLPDLTANENDNF